jgi:hypothetical protein
VPGGGGFFQVALPQLQLGQFCQGDDAGAALGGGPVPYRDGHGAGRAGDVTKGGQDGGALVGQ